MPTMFLGAFYSFSNSCHDRGIFFLWLKTWASLACVKVVMPHDFRLRITLVKLSKQQVHRPYLFYGARVHVSAMAIYASYVAYTYGTVVVALAVSATNVFGASLLNGAVNVYNVVVATVHRLPLAPPVERRVKATFLVPCVNVFQFEVLTSPRGGAVNDYVIYISHFF